MNTLIRLFLALLVLPLSACGPSGDTEALKQNVEKNKLGISSVIIKPKYTRTLEVTSSPDNTKYYFDHHDSEPLQAFGITDSNEEVPLTDVTWGLTDNSPTAGATTIDQDGVLKTETLAANQTKDITVNVRFASLEATAGIVISSFPLSANGLSIKIDDTVVTTTQSVVVCDSLALTAEGLFEDDSRRDITSKIDWSKALNNANAKFNTTDRNKAVFSSYANAVYTVEPNYKGQGSASLDLSVTENNFKNFTISPSKLSLAPDDTYTLVASADIDSGNGSVRKDVSAQTKWTSADESVIRVDDAGRITAIAAGGPTAATAQCGSTTMSSNITVAVENVVMYVKILDNDSNTILRQDMIVNDTVNLKLFAYLADGSEQDVTTNANTSWTVRTLSGTGTPVTVNNTDNKGLVSAAGVGAAEVVATYKERDDDLYISVTSN